ncbi:MAG: hypothetical protein I8H66_07630 [Sphingobacteriia bacterium]|nr:hypothetical protein [Sphingobacteriia bacterium]
MCKHADQTKRIIDHLLSEVYPGLMSKIKYALSCVYQESSDAPDKLVMIDLIGDLKNEFSSLITYEQKLVFPSVLKVFLTKKENETLPNLVDLLQLTKSKEHKIMHHVKRLMNMLEKPMWNTTEQEILAKAFVNEFMLEKQLWYQMIDDRINTCGCFRRNYNEIEKMYNKHGDVSNGRHQGKNQ